MKRLDKGSFFRLFACFLGFEDTNMNLAFFVFQIFHLEKLWFHSPWKCWYGLMTVGSGDTHYSKFSRPHDGVVVLGGMGKLHHCSSVDIQRVLILNQGNQLCQFH